MSGTKDNINKYYTLGHFETYHVPPNESSQKRSFNTNHIIFKSVTCLDVAHQESPTDNWIWNMQDYRFLAFLIDCIVLLLDFYSTSEPIPIIKDLQTSLTSAIEVAAGCIGTLPQQACLLAIVTIDVCTDFLLQTHYHLMPPPLKSS